MTGKAFGTNQSVVKVYKMLQELVGDVQLARLTADVAVEEEPMEATHVKDMFKVETELMLRTSWRAKLKPVAREESTSVEQRERDVVHGKGVDIVRMQQTVEGFCCGHGFLKDDIQQKEDDCRKKLVLRDKKSLSYGVEWLSLGATLYSTTRFFKVYISKVASLKS